MPSCFQFEAFPGRCLRVALFTDVTNGGALLQLITSGALAPEAALLNASMVRRGGAALSLPTLRWRLQVAGAFPLQLAAFKAVASQTGGHLVTRTLHSELVFNLSATNHVR